MQFLAEDTRTARINLLLELFHVNFEIDWDSLFEQIPPESDNQIFERAAQYLAQRSADYTARRKPLFDSVEFVRVVAVMYAKSALTPAQIRMF